MRRDEGFSVAEIVIAAAILFFVLTAMIGLVGASQRISVTARQRAAVTNALAQYIDRIRAMEYDQIALEPDGSLKANDSVSYADPNNPVNTYTVTFSNRVVFPDGRGGQALRTVHITATCSTGGRTYRTTSVVSIRNPDSDTTVDSLVDPNLPQIEFVSPTPPADSVVTGKQLHPSYLPLKIAVRVKSPQDKIRRVELVVDGEETVFLRNHAGASGDDAVWEIDPPQQNVLVESGWDTTQEGVKDGFRTVMVKAYDDQDRPVQTLSRRFIVDNVAPGLPGTPVGAARTSTLGELQFAAAPDPVPNQGFEAQWFATRYAYELYKEPLNGGDWSLVSSGTVEAGSTYAQAMVNKGPIIAPVNTEPFSRYWAKVRAGSPRDFNTQGSEMVTPFVSKPETHSDSTYQSTCLTAYTKSGANRTTDYNAVIYVTKPQFPVNGNITYYYQYKVAGTSTWQEFEPFGGSTAVEDGDFIKLTFTFRKLGSESQNLYFRIGMKCTPGGWAGGTQTPILYSNAIGITPRDTNQSAASNSGTQPLTPDVTWTE